MSEHPTERFERPPVPPAEPEPVAPPDDYNPLFDPPLDPPPPAEPFTTRAVPAPPPPAPPTVTQPISAVPGGVPPRTDEWDPARRASATAGAGRAEQSPPAAVRVAKQWFAQSDNLLLAVTAAVAVVFLVLVAILP